MTLNALKHCAMLKGGQEGHVHSVFTQACNAGARMPRPPQSAFISRGDVACGRWLIMAILQVWICWRYGGDGLPVSG